MKLIPWGLGPIACQRSSPAPQGVDRADVSDALINDEMQLNCDMDGKSDDMLVEAARQVWPRVYGAPRETASRPSRFDKGRSRPEFRNQKKNMFGEQNDLINLLGWGGAEQQI